MNDQQHAQSGPATEQAAYWIVRQNSGNWNDRDARDFKQWLAESPKHRQAFEQVQSLWQGLDRFKTPATQPLASPAPQPGPVRKRIRWVVGGVCASIAMIGLLRLNIDSAYFTPSESIYTTAKGQQTSFTLADGSEIVLNTDTELKVQFNPLSRVLTLNRGEASFHVAHETFRGFTVAAGHGEIIDIGTRFNVYQTPEQVVVTVTEGAVKVKTGQAYSVPLVAGQRLSYNADGLLSLPDRPDLNAVTAWRQGLIVFDMTPLNEATTQIARYHPVRFIFDDAALKNLRVSGTFNAKDLPQFLTTLEQIYPLQAQRGNDQTVHLKNAARR